MLIRVTDKRLGCPKKSVNLDYRLDILRAMGIYKSNENLQSNAMLSQKGTSFVNKGQNMLHK